MANAKAFATSFKPLTDKIAAIKGKFAGTPVTASEPVFGPMATVLGLDMHNEKFQLAVMNNAEPGATEIAAFEDELKQHKVKLMVFNSQASDPAVTRLLNIAKTAKVAIVGVTETEPAGTAYQDWMLGQLEAIDAALAGAQ